MNSNVSLILTLGVVIGVSVTLFIIGMLYLYTKEIKKSNIFKYGCKYCNCKKFIFIRAAQQRCHDAGSESWTEWVREYKCNNCGAVYNVTGEISKEEADIIWS